MNYTYLYDSSYRFIDRRVKKNRLFKKSQLFKNGRRSNYSYMSTSTRIIFCILGLVYLSHRAHVLVDFGNGGKSSEGGRVEWIKDTSPRPRALVPFVRLRFSLTYIIIQYLLQSTNVSEESMIFVSEEHTCTVYVTYKVESYIKLTLYSTFLCNVNSRYL